MKTMFFISMLFFGLSANAQSQKDTTAKDSSLNHPLAEKVLETVTVSSKKPFIVITAEKTTLNVAQSPIAAGSNAYDIIKKAPGVAEQSDELLYKSKSTRVLINNRPANVSGEDLKDLLSSMPGANIPKIELLSNPSSKYDAQGGAVINIVTAKDKAYGTNYTLNAGIGAGKYIKANTGIDVNYQNKDINIYGGYSFMHNREYDINNSTRYLVNGSIASYENSKPARNSNSLKLGADYDLSKKSSIGFLINGFLNYGVQDAENTSSLHYNTNIADSSSKVFTKGSARKIVPMINIYFKTAFDSTGKELVLNGDFMNYNKKSNYDFTNEYFDTKGMEYLAPSYINNNSPADISVYSFSVDYAQPAKNGKWEAGIKNSYTVTDNNVFWKTNSGNGWTTDAGKTNHFIYKEFVNAAYLNYSVTLKKWSIQSGLRGELTNTTGNSVTLNQVSKKKYFDLFPNLAVQFSKNENNEIGFSYRKSIYRYGFDYVNPFITYHNQYAYSQGNPAIEPELEDNFELSYTYKQAYSLSLDYSHGRRTLGPVYLQGNDNTTITSYANYNSSNIMYASFSAYQPVTKYWTISINPMVGFITLNNKSTVVSNTSNKRTLITQLDWTNSFTFSKGWSAELAVMYISPFQYGSYKTKTFFNTDMGISKNILKNKGSLKLSISDIFNTLNSNMNINYDGVITSVKQKEESRFINLAFRYKFGNKNVKAKEQRDSKVDDIRNRIK